MTYLVSIGGKLYFNRRITSENRAYDSRPLIRISLKTKDWQTALRKAIAHNNSLEAYWHTLVDTGQTHSSERYKTLVERARALGFAYYFSPELAGLLPQEIMARLFYVEKCKLDEKHVEAVIGKEPTPEVRLSEALNRYWGIAKDQTINKTPDQIRKWENPRKRAIKNFIKRIGNKPLTQLTRDDVLRFRDWWIERVKDGQVVSATANKDFVHVKTIVSAITDNLKLKLDTVHLFKNLLLDEDDSRPRLPFETFYIVDTLLNPEKLAGLNDQAKWALYAFSETGAGFGELVGLLPEDIILDNDIPHIWIRRRKFQNLKTEFRPRKIPLVGFALEAFQAYPNGFTEYYQRPDSLSTAVSKYLNENGMMPSDQHTAYSLRHSFQDRLTAVDAPDRVQADLMGHKLNRQKYGTGATLAKKLEWMQKIQLQKVP